MSGNTSAIDVFVPGVYELLRNAADRPEGVTIHTDVPKESDEPYIRVGEIIEQPAKPFGNRGVSELLRVHLFSRHRGGQQCRAMTTWAATAMDGSRLTLEGFGSASLSVVDRTVTQDPDGTYHGILSVRARPIGTS